MSAERGRTKRDRETNPAAYNKLRRELLHCSHCPPNKGENCKGRSKHGAKKPKKKNKRF